MEKAAHGVKEMASLNWCRGAPISARARFWHKAGLPELSVNVRFRG
jgi:hypothetical protein